MNVLSAFFNLIFPRLCYGCQKPMIHRERFICMHCINQLPRIIQNRETVDPIAARFYGKVSLESVDAFLTYRKEGLTSRLIHAIKYEQCPELGEMLGAWFAHDLLRWQRLQEYDMIVPVPMHLSKQKKRGYNQSSFIARGFGGVSEIQVNEDVLLRPSKGTSQALQRGRLLRWENVMDLYQVRNAEIIKDKTVLVIDDVMTSGATLEACSLALLEAGCKSVGVASLAVAM